MTPSSRHPYRLNLCAQRICEEVGKRNIRALPIFASLGNKPDTHEAAINEVLNNRTRNRVSRN